MMFVGLVQDGTIRSLDSHSLPAVSKIKKNRSVRGERRGAPEEDARTPKERVLEPPMVREVARARVSRRAHEYVPWWTRDPADAKSNVTLRHLLSFTSGFGGGAPGLRVRERP